MSFPVSVQSSTDPGVNILGIDLSKIRANRARVIDHRLCTEIKWMVIWKICQEVNSGEVGCGSLVGLGQSCDFAIDFAIVFPRRIVRRWQFGSISGTRNISPYNYTKVVFLVLGVEYSIGE